MNAPAVKSSKLPVSYLKPTAVARWMEAGERNGARQFVTEPEKRRKRSTPAIVSPAGLTARYTAAAMLIQSGRPMLVSEMAERLCAALGRERNAKVASDLVNTMHKAGVLAIVGRAQAHRARHANLYALTEHGRAAFGGEQ